MSTSEMQIRQLHLANTPEEYLLYKAALEWDLIHPLVIDGESDLKSEFKWREKLKPFEHQIKNLITFCRRLPVTLLADDVWLWKTISAGLIMSELWIRWRLLKTLIVCPKILMPQWQEELESKFGIKSVIATGNDILKVSPPDWVGAVITSYNTARLYLEKLGHAGFDMLILDEAHKLRNLYWTQKAPEVALRFRRALEERMFKFVLMLTATPIQNRLWDLYSLVDLLTVARGHANPFGTIGLFARNFIADAPSNARKLKNQDEFRSIVYGYMSRVRRWDANLLFPERVIQLHRVAPNHSEMELIRITSRNIEKMNKLVQIWILQSLISSPEALVSRLEHMVQNKNLDPDVMNEIRNVARRVGTTSKLSWLSNLLAKLKSERPQDWRVVVFTRWRETQTSILCHLEEQGIRCWVINWDTGMSNQEMISKFKKERPEINVIVSTEAGSEWVNLQAANVLVNYDLPWNPMIVEQRIWRIQRLWSKHENVCIYNITLEGTFEEYIVGRLMEKLQMASHAIWDIESLLEASWSGWSDWWSEKFEDEILHLVIASLRGEDTEKAVFLKEKSIETAKKQLEAEEKYIDSTLGWWGHFWDWPRTPKFPPPSYTMEVGEFVIKGLEGIWATVTGNYPDEIRAELNWKTELLNFETSEKSGDQQERRTLYCPWSPDFSRLVWKYSGKNLHSVIDENGDPEEKAKRLAHKWIENFWWTVVSMKITGACRSFVGKVLVRARATVAHDSYERLVEAEYDTWTRFENVWLSEISPISRTLGDPSRMGLEKEEIVENVLKDDWIGEFKRFYDERLREEVKRMEGDERKIKKATDDFTTRLEMAFVGAEWTAYRQIEIQAKYSFRWKGVYENSVISIPFKSALGRVPQMAECSVSNLTVPVNCLWKCAVSGKLALLEKLIRSELSWRSGLEECVQRCSVSWKLGLSDEFEISGSTWKTVAKTYMKTSDLSGKKGEAEYFSKCDFTWTEVMTTELKKSGASWKHYRMDEEGISDVTGKRGHVSEFLTCPATGKKFFPTEGETCEVTWKLVAPWVLETCQVSFTKALPIEMETSGISWKRALKKYFFTSSLSWMRILEDESVSSLEGMKCATPETRTCAWSQWKFHPADLKTCRLTWLDIHRQFLTDHGNGDYRLEKMQALLDGRSGASDWKELWGEIESRSPFKGGKIDGTEYSPDKKAIAVCLEIKTILWFKIRYAGYVYSVEKGGSIWKAPIWKREQAKWSEAT